jgi:hypothetical protein
MGENSAGKAAVVDLTGKNEETVKETVRDTITVQADGRTTIPDSVRVAIGIDKQKAFCQVETYGKDKFLVTVLTKWMPNPQRKGPGRDVLHKG